MKVGGDLFCATFYMKDNYEPKTDIFRHFFNFVQRRFFRFH